VAKEEYIFGFIDIETTGHDPLKKVGNVLVPWHEIIEIGMVVADQPNFDKLGEFEIKINPQHPERCISNLINEYPKRAFNGEWNDAVSLNCALKKLFEFLGQWQEKIIPTGHNFFFDWNFLQVAFVCCDILNEDLSRFFHYTRLDTRSMAVQELLEPNVIYDPREFSVRSGKISKRLGIKQEPYPHTALNGAMQSYKIFKKIRENVNQNLK